MTGFHQATRLQGVRYDVRGKNMVEAQAMEARGEHILKLNIGNLAPFGFATPDSVVRSVATHLPESEGYSDARGVPSARAAVAEYYQSKHLDVDPQQVLIGNGVSELISLTLSAILNHGDEVLVPAPDYPLWTAQITLCDGKAVHYLCDETRGWNPDPDDIAAHITARTKAIVLINPNNPTGAVYSADTVRAIVQLAREHDLIVLSDEIYDKIIYHGTHTYTAHETGDDVLCLTYSGLSKAYRACGFRAGWVVFTGPLQRAHNLLEGVDLLANMRMCANVPAQYAIEACLSGYQSIDELTAPGGRFEEQLRLSHDLLDQIPGVNCVPAAGALYLFPQLDPERYPITDDEDWALGLLREKKILISHGRGFNWPNPDHFRLVALPEDAVLREALGRLAEYCEETRRD